MEAFAAWAADAERYIADVAHPGFDFDHRATKGWLLTRLDHMLIVLGAYAVLVIVGMARYTPPKKEEKSQESVIASFQKEPIKVLQVIYNLVQVVLCAWMAGTAAFNAYEQNYGFVCNPFRVRSNVVAPVLWVFYLSKVRRGLPTRSRDNHLIRLGLLHYRSSILWTRSSLSRGASTNSSRSCTFITILLFSSSTGSSRCQV
jgi:hypothetical protein